MNNEEAQIQQDYDDNDKDNDVIVIGQTFKQLVGEYSILKEEEEMKERVREVMRGKQKIYGECMGLFNHGEEYTNPNVLKMVFINMQCDLDKEVFDYIIMKLLENSQTIIALDYKILFMLFQME